MSDTKVKKHIEDLFQYSKNNYNGRSSTNGYKICLRILIKNLIRKLEYIQRYIYNINKFFYRDIKI